MMLTVSMTVSHLYQNLENMKSVRSFKQASEGVNYCDKRAKSPCRRPLPTWFGGGDHLCPYGRKMIGSLVPVHSRSVRSDTYAFLDSSLKLVAFLLNYFTCFPIHNMNFLTDVVCYGWFMVLIGRRSVGGSYETFCQRSFLLPFCVLWSWFPAVSLFHRYMPFRIGCMEFCTPLQPFFWFSTLSFGWTKTCLRVV